MSFERIKDIDQEVVHKRACIILYHFTSSEIKFINNVARLTGIKDQIRITSENGNTLIRDILEDNLDTTCEEIAPYKAIIFNNIAATRMNAFIEGIKKYRISRPLIAMTTQTSIGWTFNELLKNLVEEREALKANKLSLHDEGN